MILASMNFKYRQASDLNDCRSLLGPLHMQDHNVALARSRTHLQLGPDTLRGEASGTREGEYIWPSLEFLFA